MYMNSTNPQQRQSIAANNAYIQEAEHLLQLIAQNPEERMLYESRLKGLRDFYSGLSAERRFGYEEGLQKGEITGEIRGEIRGEQLRAERIARNMLSQNMDVATIAELTSLSITEIEGLKQKDH